MVPQREFCKFEWQETDRNATTSVRLCLIALILFTSLRLPSAVSSPLRRLGLFSIHFPLQFTPLFQFNISQSCTVYSTLYLQSSTVYQYIYSTVYQYKYNVQYTVQVSTVYIYSILYTVCGNNIQIQYSRFWYILHDPRLKDSNYFSWNKT